MVARVATDLPNKKHISHGKVRMVTGRPKNKKSLHGQRYVDLRNAEELRKQDCLRHLKMRGAEHGSSDDS